MNLKTYNLSSAKYGLLIILFTLVTLYAFGEDRIKFDIQSQTLTEAFKIIQEHSNYTFVYSSNIIKSSNNINIQLQQISLDYFLNKVLLPLGYQYKVIDQTIIITKKQKTQSSQCTHFINTYTIQGKVEDVCHKPLPGVTVRDLNNSTGTYTDFHGNFSLSLKEGSSHTLNFFFVGMEEKQIEVSSTQNIKIILYPNQQKLSEVVVTALGIPKQIQTLGYSVSSLSGNDLNYVKGAYNTTALTGKVASLKILNSTEFEQAPSIYIRGESPLIVIDGIAYKNVSLDNIPSDNIKTIDILKGATASALYGIRASQGAIMISTQDQYSGKLQIHASFHILFRDGFLAIPQVQTSYSSGMYGKFGYNEYVWGEHIHKQKVYQYDPISMQEKYMTLEPRGKNNLKHFLRESMISHSHIDIQQGTNNIGYRASIHQIHHKGMVPNTQSDRYQFNLAGHLTSKKLEVRTHLAYQRTEIPNRPISGYNGENALYNIILWTGPEYDIREYKNYWKKEGVTQNWAWNTWYNNPYLVSYENKNSSFRNLTYTSLYSQYKCTPMCNISLRMGWDFYNQQESKQRAISDRSEMNGFYSQSVSQGFSYNGDLVLSQSLNKKAHHFNLLYGMSIYYFKDHIFSAHTQGGISVPQYYSINASKENPIVDLWDRSKVVQSLYFKLSYNYNQNLYLDLTGRNDWSSTLPKQHRSYFYPSIAVSFLPWQNKYNTQNKKGVLKLRSSWTLNRKDLDSYALNSLYSVQTQSWDHFTTAQYPTTIKNPKITPEYQETFEIGADWKGIFNFIELGYTLFFQKQYNRLISAGISNASGFNKQIVNTKEKLLQRGMEFNTQITFLKTKLWNIHSKANISFNHWYYLSLDPTYSSKAPWVKRGRRVDQYLARDWERDPQGHIVLQGGLPVVNPFRSPIGTMDPNYIWGWTTHVRFKKWNFHISLDGRHGGWTSSYTEQMMWASGAHPESDNPYRYDEVVNHQKNYIADGVKVTRGQVVFDTYGRVLSDTRKYNPNDVPVSYQSYILKYNPSVYNLLSRQNIFHTDFFKIREIALLYNIPQSTSKHLGFSQMQIGVMGQNLYLHSKDFRFSDPDVDFEHLNAPSQRMMGIQINMKL